MRNSCQPKSKVTNGKQNDSKYLKKCFNSLYNISAQIDAMHKGNWNDDPKAMVFLFNILIFKIIFKYLFFSVTCTVL